jgi:hypothetical protein
MAGEDTRPPSWHGKVSLSMSQELSPLDQRVRAFLISRARQADPDRPFRAKTEYQQVGRAIDPEEHYWAWPRFRGLGEVLGNVSVFEHEHDRPLLSALVVQAGTLQAGDGFYKGLLQKRLGIQLPPDQERDFWREEIRKVVTYWNAAPGEEEPDTQARVLALITKIESDLKEVRALIAAG